MDNFVINLKNLSIIKKIKTIDFSYLVDSDFETKLIL